jgi:hypothetical protein
LMEPEVSHGEKRAINAKEIAGDSKGFAKTEADVARGRYQAAAFVFVEPSMRLVSDGGQSPRSTTQPPPKSVVA